MTLGNTDVQFAAYLGEMTPAWVCGLAMTIRHWTWLIYIFMACGSGMVLTGIAIFTFSDLANSGVEGVRLIALLIGAGLLLLIPSKIFLTLLLMK